MKKITLLFISLALFSGIVNANNILVNNASISGQNTTTHTANVNFSVSWENSWRTSTNESNYDGAWVFVKFRKNGTTDWRHATINLMGFTAAGGSTITIPADGKGAFIYRSANGIGNVSYASNTLKWNYGADGILDNETVEIRVFGLEMVYIPQGSFQLGSGGVETYGFTTGSTSTPFTVTNAAITFGTSATNLNPNGNGPSAGTILPATYPTGYNAFWIMKYETSEQQYVDFLNHLDQARAIKNNTSGIYTGSHPNLVAPEPERAVNNLNSQRMAALADWSGLRPYTEMEYEKVCRGYNTPALPNEYVWGTTTINILNSVNNVGATDETVNTPANANANISYIYGFPIRTGLFARIAASTRELSGATYYGVMNMGDNVSEICVNAVNPTGLAFNGSIHGDGNLAADGDSDEPTWKNYVTYGFRGSSYDGTALSARTSDRQYANFYAYYGYDVLSVSLGGRLARTAP